MKTKLGRFSTPCSAGGAHVAFFFFCSSTPLSSSFLLSNVVAFVDFAQMTINFPKNYCDQVSGALVSAAEGMQGFDHCNGGMK